MNRPIKTILRRGFTLIEMVMSCLILSIILLGMQSVMLLAARTAPGRTTGTSSALTAARAMDSINADLPYTASMVTMNAKTIEFTVPDRTGDNSPETIRYSWSGVSGDPLLRTINGRNASTVASNVTAFQLDYSRKTLPRSQTYTESAEVLLNNYDGAGILNLGDFSVQSTTYIGQYFKPTLPNGAVKWRVTRVKFKAQERSSDDGLARVQIRTANGTTPGAVIEEKLLYESTLNSGYSWQEFTFSKVSGISPGSGLCLVIQWYANDEACNIQYQLLLASDPNGQMVKSTNAGVTWTTPSGMDMIYYVYGTYSTADAIVNDYWLGDVRCTLRCGNDATSSVATTIRLFNPPQVTGP